MNIQLLQTWYLENHRKLPFRETKNPYHIWVSEVMLQQTQVETVIPYFIKFIAIYPTVCDLAHAEEEHLLKLVEGLGYYRRFRLMHQAAKIIDHIYQGRFPNTYDEIKALPGIGEYTAGAIMSIAYNKPYSALDGNVIRVISRYMGDDRDMRQQKNRNTLNDINQSWIEDATPEIYTQAIMELGATVCKPKNPRCGMCPIQEHCVAYQQNRQDELPFLSKLNGPTSHHYVTLIIEDDDHYYLRKRDEELLKGMYEYPQFDVESIHHLETLLQEQGVELIIEEHYHREKHIFSHQVWHMEIHHARLLKGKSPHWISISKNQINEVPMATAHRKINIKR
jgi:A/G-specific adenine glycosylase